MRAGHRIHVVDDLSSGSATNLPQGVTLTQGDAADPNVIMPLVAAADGVFHLAAIASVERSRTDWRATTHANLMGTVTVLEAIAHRATPIPLVYASSAAIYGDTPDAPLREDSAACPLTPYGVDKYASELHARAGALLHGIPSAGLRLFNVYGSRQDPSSPYSGVISIFARRLLDNKNITIFGDGSQTRDFIHVSDVALLMLNAMQHLQTHDKPAQALTLNVCTGIETTILTLAHTLGALTASTGDIHHAPPRSGDIARSLGSARTAYDLLGWQPQVTLEAGLRETLDWMRHNV